ncbi:MAG: hypothetical protein V3U65_20290 [Granulosicoccaceae bacterium]
MQNLVPNSPIAGKSIGGILLTVLLFGHPGVSESAVSDNSGASMAISCSDNAQAAFDRGLTLLHHMMYNQASSTFSEGATESPECAMLHWGVAMSQFQPVRPGVPSEEAMSEGRKSVSLMLAIDDVSALEHSFANSVSAFYQDETAGYRERIIAWAAAQEIAYKEFNDDIDTTAFYALSLLATAPRSDKTFSQQNRAGLLLEALNENTELHPGVYHYAIHAYDNPKLYERGLSFANKYGKIAPDVPHALHMPSHIFVRSGQWDEVIQWNEGSANAAMEQSVDGEVSSNYAHAMDYLIYAHLQKGEFETAENLLAEFVDTKNHQSNFGSAYALAASPMRVLLEQERWEKAARISPQLHDSISWEKFPQTEAMLWFGKGIGAARIDDEASASSALAELQEIKTSLEKLKQPYWIELLASQMLSVEAWMELNKGNTEKAIEMQTKAADIEDAAGKSPVTPGHILPQRELLGDMLALLGKISESNKAYELALINAPNRRRSVLASQ